MPALNFLLFPDLRNSQIFADLLAKKCINFIVAGHCTYRAIIRIYEDAMLRAFAQEKATMISEVLLEIVTLHAVTFSRSRVI